VTVDPVADRGEPMLQQCGGPRVRRVVAIASSVTAGIIARLLLEPVGI
jgi:hypothetical protein